MYLQVAFSPYKFTFPFRLSESSTFESLHISQCENVTHQMKMGIVLLHTLV